MGLRSLYVDLNSFFASCEQQEDAALRGRPVAVVPMLADSTAVIAASYEAKAFGVKTGVRVGDAKRMCPGLKLVPARHSIYIKYHHRIIEAVESCMPVRAVCSIDEIAGELTGTQRQPDVAVALAAKIKKTIRERVGGEMRCSVGIASNFLLAKMACDMQKPDGLTLLMPSEVRSRLSALPLRDVPGIGPRMEKRMNAQAITTMAQLLACDEARFRLIWGGVVGARYHFMLNGGWMDLEDRPRVKSIGHSHVLPPVDRSFNGAWVIAQRLLWKTSIRLRRQEVMARKLALSVRFLEGDGFQADVKLDETQDSSELLKRLRDLYGRVPRTRRPLKVGVTLSNFIEEDQHQLSFFTDEKKQNLFRVVDSINARFGRDTISPASLQPHREKAPTRIAFSRIPGLDEVEQGDDVYEEEL